MALRSSSSTTGSSSCDLVLAGRGGDAEDAGIGEGPMEGIDRVAEAALLAHFLEQPARHAAAQDRGEDLHGVKAVRVIGPAFHAQDDMGLLVVGHEPLLALDIGGLGRRRRAGGLEVVEAIVGDIDQLVVIDIAGRAQHHVIADIVAIHVGTDGLRAEAVHRLRRCRE